MLADPRWTEPPVVAQVVADLAAIPDVLELKTAALPAGAAAAEVAEPVAAHLLAAVAAAAGLGTAERVDAVVAGCQCELSSAEHKRLVLRQIPHLVVRNP